MTTETSEDKIPLLNDEDSKSVSSAQPQQAQATTAVSVEPVSGELGSENNQGKKKKGFFCFLETIVLTLFLGTTIFEAAQRGSFQTLRYLLDNKLATVKDVDSQGATALHYATLANNDVCLKYLIDKGSVIDAPAGDLNATPLHWACRYIENKRGKSVLYY